MNKQTPEMKTPETPWQNTLIAIEAFDGWIINDALGNVIASKIDIGPDMGERAAKHIVHCVNNFDSQSELLAEVIEENKKLKEELQELKAKYDDSPYQEWKNFNNLKP